jgi:hypothetical protein
LPLALVGQTPQQHAVPMEILIVDGLLGKPIHAALLFEVT